MSGVGARPADDVLSLGYQGVDLERFVQDLVSKGVETVVDVRLNPVSRKRGFSKNALAQSLRARGIDYRHEFSLGNPRHNRAGFSELETERGVAARNEFTRGLVGPEARLALARTAELAAQVRVGVLCFESDDRYCHRHQVLLALEAHRSTGELNPES